MENNNSEWAVERRWTRRRGREDERVAGRWKVRGKRKVLHLKTSIAECVDWHCVAMVTDTPAGARWTDVNSCNSLRRKTSQLNFSHLLHRKAFNVRVTRFFFSIFFFFCSTPLCSGLLQPAVGAGGVVSLANKSGWSFSLVSWSQAEYLGWAAAGWVIIQKVKTNSSIEICNVLLGTCA